jgi:hypothetical protein
MYRNGIAFNFVCATFSPIGCASDKLKLSGVTAEVCAVTTLVIFNTN